MVACRRTPLAAYNDLFEQFFQTVDQVLNRERFNEVLGVCLREEQIDFRLGSETCDEDETISENGTEFACLEVELVTSQFRHHHVANYGIVFVGLDLEDGFFAVVGNINEEILVGQNPLESLCQLLIVVDQQKSFEINGFRRPQCKVWLVFE